MVFGVLIGLSDDPCGSVLCMAMSEAVNEPTDESSLQRRPVNSIHNVMMRSR